MEQLGLGKVHDLRGVEVKKTFLTLLAGLILEDCVGDLLAQKANSKHHVGKSLREMKPHDWRWLQLTRPLLHARWEIEHSAPISRVRRQ